MLHAYLFGCLSFVQEALLQVDAQVSAMVSTRLQTPTRQQRGLPCYVLCTV